MVGLLHVNLLHPARFVQQVGTYLKPCNVVNLMHRGAYGILQPHHLGWLDILVQHREYRVDKLSV